MHNCICLLLVILLDRISLSFQQKPPELWLDSLPTMRVLRGDLYYYDLSNITNVTEPLYTAIDADPSIIRIKPALDEQGQSTPFPHAGCQQYLPGPGAYRFTLLCNQSKLVVVELHPDTKATTALSSPSLTMPQLTRCTKMFAESDRIDIERGDLKTYGQVLHLLCAKEKEGKKILTVASLKRDTLEFVDEIEITTLSGQPTSNLEDWDFSGGIINGNGVSQVTIVVYKPNPYQHEAPTTWFLIQSDGKHKLELSQQYSQDSGSILNCGYPGDLPLQFHSVFYSKFPGQASSFYLVRTSVTGDVYATKIFPMYTDQKKLPESFSCEYDQKLIGYNGQVTKGLKGKGLPIALKLFDDVYGGANSLMIWTPDTIRETLVGSSSFLKKDADLVRLSLYKAETVSDVFVFEKILYIVAKTSQNGWILIRSKEISRPQSPIRIDQHIVLGIEAPLPIVFVDEIDARRQAFAFVYNKSLTVGKVGYNMLRASIVSNGSEIVEHTYKISLKSARSPEVSSLTNTIEYQIVPDISQLRADQVPQRIDLYTGTNSYTLQSYSTALVKLGGTLTINSKSDLKVSFKKIDPQPLSFWKSLTPTKGTFRVSKEIVGLIQDTGVAFVQCPPEERGCNLLFVTEITSNEVSSFKLQLAIESSRVIVILTEEVSQIKPNEPNQVLRVFSMSGTILQQKTYPNLDMISATVKAPEQTSTVSIHAVVRTKTPSQVTQVVWLELDLKKPQATDWTVALTLPSYICPAHISAKQDPAASGTFDIVSLCDRQKETQPRIYSWNIPMAPEDRNASLMVNSFVLIPPTQKDGSISTLKYCSFGDGVLIVFYGSSTTEGYNVRFSDRYGLSLARMVYGLGYYDIQDVLQLECLPDIKWANLLVKTRKGQTLVIGLEYFESGRIFDRIGYALEVSSHARKVFSVISQGAPASGIEKPKLHQIVVFSQTKESASVLDLSGTTSIPMTKDYYKVNIDTTGASPFSGTFDLNYKYFDGISQQQKVGFEIHSRQPSISSNNVNKQTLQTNSSGQFSQLNLEEILNLSGDYLSAKLVGLDPNSTEMKSLELVDRYMQTNTLQSSLYTFSKFMAYKSYILAPVEGDFLYLFKGNKVVASKRCKSSNMKMIVQGDAPTFFAAIKTLDPTEANDGTSSKIAIISKVSDDPNQDDDWQIIEYPLPFNSVRTLKVSSWGLKNHFVYSLTTQDNLNKSKIFTGVLKVSVVQGQMRVAPLYDQLDISFDYPINDYMMVPTYQASAIITVSTQYKSSIHVLMLRPNENNGSLTWWQDSSPAVAQMTANVLTLGCTGLGHFGTGKPWNEKNFLCTLVPEGSAIFYTVNISLNLLPRHGVPLVTDLSVMNSLKSIDGFRPVYAMTDRQNIIFYSKNMLPESSRTEGIYKEDMIVQVYDMVKDTHSTKVICSYTLQTPTVKTDKKSSNRIIQPDSEYPSRVFFNSSGSSRPDYMGIPYFNPSTFSSGIVTFQESALGLKILSDEHLETILDKVSIELTDINYKTVRIPLKDFLSLKPKSYLSFSFFAYLIAGIVLVVACGIFFISWKVMKLKTASTALNPDAAAAMSYQSSFSTGSDVYFVSPEQEKSTKTKRTQQSNKPDTDDMPKGKINEEL